MNTTATEIIETIGHLAKRFRSRIGRPWSERRLTQRVELRIPIHVRAGAAEPKSTRLHDISPSGLCFDGRLSGNSDGPVWIRFGGYPGVCQSFVLTVNLVRTTGEEPARSAVTIDREQSRQEALKEYGKIVLHYLRHRPLLEDRHAQLVEGRCPTCGWLGRVSSRNPTCSKCGMPVEVLAS